ncbi:MAG: thiol-disulfide oxidoreductase DCC family protein [Bacteroidales bacterium]
MNDTKIIFLLFDGDCTLCNSMIKFIIKNDTHKKFRYIALQSNQGQILLNKFNLSTDIFNSLVFIQSDQYYLKSSAVLNVLKELEGIWKLFYVLIILPIPIRDFIYNFISKIRFKIFGKVKSCKLYDL